ncbi:MAG TPA: glycosyltransferase family 2 protein [Candidatus Acidoferrum sp.]|nr:glycosyltransferase family 2 protein [Candidatus Acidoferrum sp.]
MSDAPLVTVVTPSFNHGRFIRETIESVLTQTYPRIEYLVMDGGSTDETVDVLTSYGNRLTWMSEPDGGQTQAINKGWRRARGTILAYLNSDDTYLPGAVETAVRAFDAQPDAAAVYGEGYHVDEAGRVIERYPTEPFDMARLAQTCFICQPTVFLRREAVARVGYLDESRRYCMDYDLWIRLGQASRFVYVPAYLATTRRHAASVTSALRGPVHAEILDTVYRHFGRVSSQWVYGYARSVLHGRRRDGGGVASAFALRLVAVSLLTFARYRSSIPRADWRQWSRWIRDAMRPR